MGDFIKTNLCQNNNKLSHLIVYRQQKDFYFNYFLLNKIRVAIRNKQILSGN
jgi:hypothetical protein